MWKQHANQELGYIYIYVIGLSFFLYCFHLSVMQERAVGSPSQSYHSILLIQIHEKFLEEKKKLNICILFCGMFPRRINFMCRRFGTLCQFHIHRWRKHEDRTDREFRNVCTEKFRSRGIIQNKEYYIQNSAKVWNQELCLYFLKFSCILIKID